MTRHELDRLRRWKKEAKQVLADWELVWEALGCPGELGQSKAQACLQEIQRRESNVRGDHSAV